MSASTKWELRGVQFTIHWLSRRSFRVRLTQGLKRRHGWASFHATTFQQAMQRAKWFILHAPFDAWRR